MDTPKKATIPKALREQVWLGYMGRVFEGKCRIRWCQNTISVFDFQCGHNVAESKGGATNLENLVPICSRCNVSMGNQYTIDEWNKMGPEHIPARSRWLQCLQIKRR
jgi:5-methylcytosine-specific restriction endonuclease McrA